jgi:hypothetical protein
MELHHCIKLIYMPEPQQARETCHMGWPGCVQRMAALHHMTATLHQMMAALHHMKATLHHMTGIDGHAVSYDGHAAVSYGLWRPRCIKV